MKMQDIFGAIGVEQDGNTPSIELSRDDAKPARAAPPLFVREPQPKRGTFARQATQSSKNSPNDETRARYRLRGGQAIPELRSRSRSFRLRRGLEAGSDV